MIEEISKDGLVMVGCGFMGQALMEGWLAKSVPREALFVVDPNPSDWLRQQDGINVNTDLPASPAVIVIATKPQILDAVLPSLTHLGSANSVVVSIAAGVGVDVFEEAFGASAPIARAMPNLPATIREGITALHYNARVTSSQKQLVAELFQASGHVIQIDNEQDLHAVTALSGSGPAYVFAFAEALMRAGEGRGLSTDVAKALAIQTLVGAATMLAQGASDAKSLKVAVTSKGGTTAAGLAKFDHEGHGITDLVERTLEAAASRSRELGSIT